GGGGAGEPLDEGGGGGVVVGERTAVEAKIAAAPIDRRAQHGVEQVVTLQGRRQPAAGEVVGAILPSVIEADVGGARPRRRRVRIVEGNERGHRRDGAVGPVPPGRDARGRPAGDPQRG